MGLKLAETPANVGLPIIRAMKVSKMKIGIALFNVPTRFQIRTIRQLLVKHKPSMLLIEIDSELSRMVRVMFRGKIPVYESSRAQIVEYSELLISSAKIETRAATLIYVRKDGYYQMVTK